MPKRPPKRKRDFEADALLAYCRQVAKQLPDEDGAQSEDVALRAIGAVFWRWMEGWSAGHHGFFDPKGFLSDAQTPSHAQRVFLDRRCQALGTHPLPAAVAAVLSDAVRQTAATLSVEELVAIRRQVMGLR